MGEKIERQCPVCGGKYFADLTRLKWGRETTCSRRCSYLLRASKLHKSQDFVCPVCGEHFEVAPSRLKNAKYTPVCSLKCLYTGRSLGIIPREVTKPYEISEAGRIAQRENGKRLAVQLRQICEERGYWQTESSRARLSQATAENIASGKINRVSQIEYIVVDELTSLDIKFNHQFHIRDKKTGRYNAVVDFYLPDLNIALEVNGTFWHADPRFYDHAGLAPSQLRTLEHYSRKTEILQQQDIELREVWEHDLKQDARIAVSNSLVGLI